jgi:2-methylisocitrate lyase-like PEP mutase family enzyme
MTMAGRLRQLLAAPGVVVVAECYSVLTARVVEKAGFPATYIGGEAMGQMHAAIPDHGLVTIPEMLAFAERITGSISIPLIADADQGGETALNVRRTVRDFEHAGVAGIHIEDTVNPKHLYEGDRQASVDIMRARIGAAVEARRDDDFVIIARTDEFVKGGDGGVEEAIRRGVAFADAGADVFMAVGIPGTDAMKAIVQAVPIPVLDINRRVAQAEETGLKIDLFASSAVPTAIRAHQALLEEIRTTGRLDVKSRRLDADYLAELLDDAIYVDLARAWSAANS